MPTHDNQHISTLVARSAGGDTRAFAALMGETQQYAFSLAFRMLCDEDDAKDVVQEAFVRVWRHLGSFDGSSKFTTWLYSIVSRLCLDRLRARARQSANNVDLEACEGLSHAGEHPATAIENRELASIIEGLAGRLSPTQRLVFTLRDLQDLPVAEVCAITGLSEGSVKTNLCYARKALRALFDAHERVGR
jgi:RNA polymerase sigma-70 factor (ECF subfamily)